MTTTAYDDQFSAEPEPVHQPYDVAAILRQNIAGLEKELQRQRQRAETALAELLATRDDNHRMTGEILALKESIEKAEWELKAAREQEPVGEYEYYEGMEKPIAYIYGEVGEGNHELYARPIPAPAVPEEWRKDDPQLGEVILAKRNDGLPFVGVFRTMPCRSCINRETGKWVEFSEWFSLTALMQSAGGGK